MFPHIFHNKPKTVNCNVIVFQITSPSILQSIKSGHFYNLSKHQVLRRNVYMMLLKVFKTLRKCYQNSLKKRRFWRLNLQFAHTHSSHQKIEIDKCINKYMHCARARARSMKFKNYGSLFLWTRCQKVFIFRMLKTGVI